MPQPRKEKRRYRKVLCRMYADEKFRQLSPQRPSGQTLWTYLITGPHTTSVPGLFHAGEAQLAERLGWPLAAFRRCWREVADQGMAEADWPACVVWLPSAIRHNVPESPNVVTSWKDHLDELPACALRDRALCDMDLFLATVGDSDAFQKAFQKVLPHGFASTFLKGRRDPSRNQDQEQDQEDLPPTPHAVARGALGRITRAERKQAEQIRRNWFGCRHEPRCPNAEACVRVIVSTLREQSA